MQKYCSESVQSKMRKRRNGMKKSSLGENEANLSFIQVYPLKYIIVL